MHSRSAAARSHHHRSIFPHLLDRDLLNFLGGDDDSNDDDGSNINNQLTVTTRVQTIALPGTTRLITQIVPVFTNVGASLSTALSAGSSVTSSSSVPILTTSPAVSVTPSSQLSATSASSTLPSSSLTTSLSLLSTSSSSSASSVSILSTPSPTVLPSTPTGLAHTSSTSSSATRNPAISPSADAASSSVNTSQSSGLSTGTIVAIAAGGGVVALAFLIYFVRKCCLRKRQNKRDTWSANMFPDTGFNTHEKSISPLSTEEQFSSRSDNAGSRSFNTNQTSRRSPQIAPQVTLSTPQPSYNNPAPPAISYNSVPPAASYKPIAPPMAYNQAPPPMPHNRAPPPAPYNPIYSAVPPSNTSPIMHPAALTPAAPLMPNSSSASWAYVRSGYMPNLPDELSISTGDTVRVLNEYDDGWALCANGRGEQGVVPVECLQRNQARPAGSGQGYLGEGTGDWRMSHRASSLYNPQGIRA